MILLTEEIGLGEQRLLARIIQGQAFRKHLGSSWCLALGSPGNNRLEAHLGGEWRETTRWLEP